MTPVDELNAQIAACERCGRLCSYIREVATVRRRAFREQDYWGRPVPNFGDPNGRLLIVGLAPAAHGANRTGRMFTGDESGNWLFRALHEAGFASQPDSTGADDGLRLKDALITAAVHCAPPANKPSRDEFENCRAWLVRTLGICSRWKVTVVLGRIAFQETLKALDESGLRCGIRQSAFAHGAELPLPDGRFIVCSYHPSQQNTFTRRLTREMLLGVFLRAAELAR